MVVMPSDDKSNNFDHCQHRRNDDRGAYAVSGYDNKAFKQDGDLGDVVSKPPMQPEDEQVPKGKFKMSRKEKWRILKNIATISFAFMVQFTAFQGTANLQSSINAKDGLGTVSLSAVYAALVISCIFVPTFLIKRLTVKWTLCFSLLCYAPYIAAQFYPRFYTLVPAGILVGLGAAPMWAAKATYLTQVAAVYAKLTDQPVDGIVVRFFGFFFLAWQTAELWGNLISSLVLSSGVHGGGSQSSHTLTDDNLKVCGSNFCFVESAQSGNLERPPDSEIYEISIIYLACIAIAVSIIAFLLDPLSRYSTFGQTSLTVKDAGSIGRDRERVRQKAVQYDTLSEEGRYAIPTYNSFQHFYHEDRYGEKQRRADAQELTGIQLLSATAYQLKKPYQQLLIPITIWIGMEQAFIGAEFTQAYISCALGIHSVGYVMICFGVVNAICSLLFGTLMKYIGRSPLMGLGFAVHACLIWVLIIWRPHPSSPHIFFTISGLWGVGDAVWQTQVNGIYGTLFRRNKEAAFSNFRLWESTGFVIAYAYSTHLCERMKLYVMGCVLVIGFICYIIVEIRHKIRAKRRKSLAEDPKAAAAEAAKPNNVIEETDDEKDDIDDEIIVTHL